MTPEHMRKLAKNIRSEMTHYCIQMDTEAYDVLAVLSNSLVNTAKEIEREAERTAQEEPK